MIERWAAGVLCALALGHVLAWLPSLHAQQRPGGREQDRGANRGAELPQTRTQTPLPQFDRASLERGRAVVVGATQGSGQGAAQPCFTCHGLTGAGDGTSAFPRMAAQPAFYLYKQLVDYAIGERPNDIMTPIARALTLRQMEDVAAYYAAQASTPPYAAPQFDPALVQRGGAISSMGAPEKGIQACVNCHGASGTGLAPSFPYLAGQYAGYIELQLKLWQQGVRRNDPLNVMADIARRMGPQEIEAVAAYFGSAPPPGTEQSRPRTELDTVLPQNAPSGSLSGAGQ
jgi:cytochrome c553